MFPATLCASKMPVAFDEALPTDVVVNFAADGKPLIVTADLTTGTTQRMMCGVWHGMTLQGGVSKTLLSS